MRRLHCAPKSPISVVFSTALLALSAAACGSSKPPHAAAVEAAAGGRFGGAALPSEAPRDFTLTDEDGREVSSREYRGRVVVLAFAGARCGAPCTVIADQIRGALDQISERVPALIVSVDPGGDDAAAVARFLARASLSGRVRFLTGSPAKLRAVWRAYRVPAPARSSTAFERFAPVLLLDRSGRARVEYGLEQLTPEALAHDIRSLAR
jgi:protein SCO1/2